MTENKKPSNLNNLSNIALALDDYSNGVCLTQKEAADKYGIKITTFHYYWRNRERSRRLKCKVQELRDHAICSPYKQDESQSSVSESDTEVEFEPVAKPTSYRRRKRVKKIIM